MLFQLPGLGAAVREAAKANVSLRKFASVLIFIILVYLSSAGHSNSARIMKHRNYRQGFINFPHIVSKILSKTD